MENEKSPVFINGMFFKSPDERTKEKAPWVKGHISIKMADFIPFIKEHKEEDWLNIDLKKSKGGKLYLELNTWKPKQEDIDAVKAELKGEAVEAEDIPFD